MYHDIIINDGSESGFQNPSALKYKVKSDCFEEQVSAVDSYLRMHNLPRSAVEFTFDDGGVSFITIAATILEKYGFRGVFFISTAYIGSKGFLDAYQIKELVRRGHIVGSHSHSHPQRISSLPDNEIWDEWKYSNELLSECLGKTPFYASIPNGYSSKSVLNAMINAGISKIYTSKPTIHKRNFNGATLSGRYVITDSDTSDSVMRILTSESFRFKQTLRYNSLAIVKTLLGDFYLKLRSIINHK